mgnify:CR=1 FL=1
MCLSLAVRRVVAVVGVARLVRYFLLGHLADSLPIALEALRLVRAAAVSRMTSDILLASLPIFREAAPFAVAFVFYNAAVGIGGTARSSYISSVAPVGSEATTPAVSNIAIRASSVPSVALSGYIMELEPAAAMPLAGLMLIAAGAIMWKMLKEPEEFTH